MENTKIGGNGKIIEVDEALLGKKPTYGHGHISKAFKIWVLGICVRDVKGSSKEFILIPVPKRDEHTLGYIFDKLIDKESILFSDGWASYIPLGR